MVRIVERTGTEVAPDAVDAPAGWHVRRSFDLPSRPWDLSARQLMVIAEVVDEADARAAMSALTRGVGLTLWVQLTGAPRQRFLEDLHKVATPSSFEPTTDQAFSDMQRGLMNALADGATVTSAAEMVHISRRTANRLLTEVREALQVDSNRAAITRWSAERP